ALSGGSALRTYLSRLLDLDPADAKLLLRGFFSHGTSSAIGSHTAAALSLSITLSYPYPTDSSAALSYERRYIRSCSYSMIATVLQGPAWTSDGPRSDYPALPLVGYSGFAGHDTLV